MTFNRVNLYVKAQGKGLLKILLQVHPAIETRDLVVTIEHQRRTLQEFA